ncbi:UNVERIFIED_CONTAM: hypothetical protein RMT77_015811 [Armadillidium vulgare]|nr:CCAAT/enhancer-binding protein beta [Armadillidium vulgare]
MESPHLYENTDYKKGSLTNLKVKGGQNLFGDVGEYNDLNCELANSEISLDLQNFIDENQQNQLVSEHLIQELQSLNVDKNSLSNTLGGQCPRGIGANPGLGGVPPPLVNSSSVGAMYNPLAYLPQPVHSGSQFDRQFHERLPIKEEPQDGPGDPHHEYAPCARVNYGGYGGGISPYPMTPTTVPGVDSLLKSPMKSPGGPMKPGGMKTPKADKSTDEYRRRRERNNIAVRKSREKAKARSRETEERVKILTDENKKLQEKCKVLLEKVSMYHSVFSSMNLQCLPEPFRSELRNQMEVLNNQHQHQQILGL